MINIRQLTRYYGHFLAVDNISFDVNKGEILGFLGPNGAGKTTTMKMITGFLMPSAGTITIDELDVVQNPMKIKQKIGYLPEHNALYLDMNIIEYLTFIMEARGIDKNLYRSRLQYVIDVCGLSRELTKNIGQLSKGYRQRVGLAQALIHDPEILILDEPTVGLDPNQIVEIRNLIKKIGEQKTIILSTHILPEVEVTCNRVIIINKGSIAAMGSLDELHKSFAGNDKLKVVVEGDHQDKASIFTSLNAVLTHTVAFNGEETTFELGVEKDQDIRSDIRNLLSANKIPLLELKREPASLETVFHSLTIDQPELPSTQTNA